MQLIEVDGVDVERATTALAGGDEVFRAAVGLPPAVGPRHPAFGCYRYLRSIARPRAQRVRDQSLVVTDLTIVPAIDVGGVQQRDTGVEGRVTTTIGNEAALLTGAKSLNASYLILPGLSSALTSNESEEKRAV